MAESNLTGKEIGEIPLREFKGYLKRHRLSDNETMAALMVDLAFPNFTGSFDLNVRRITAAFQNSRGEVTPPQTRRRRFSGDSYSTEPLPRDRYFSVCKESADGPGVQVSDNGTLRSELLAYAHYRASGPVMLLDVQDSFDRTLLASLGHPAGKDPRRDAFTVLFFSKQEMPSILELIFSTKVPGTDFNFDKLGGAITMIRLDSNPFSFVQDKGKPVLVEAFDLQYQHETVHLKKVVDLRYPETQEGFVRTFCPSLLNSHPGIGPLGDFLELLPLLVSNSFGGTIETDFIGSYLRSQGVDALIFPSARYNGWVRFKGDDLVDFSGWNLVDYRDAKVEHPVGFRTINPPGRELHIRVDIPPISNECGYGSWKIRGAMERSPRFEEAAKLFFDPSG